ncbi:phosphatase domain-containing protein [Deinococcus aetherius]|uniref:phosphatase domain-containing protein n=1 Tax=Deinococcus aetherius TaxID=200252 RepID=UPI0031E81C0E
MTASLRTLLHVRGLPEGPLFLRDLFRKGATEHKGRVLGTLARITTARFTLIGDSGERDPETYARFVREHPGRAERLLIRDVGTPARRQEVERLLTPLGVPFGFLPAAP